jgi:hypothetical protein
MTTPDPSREAFEKWARSLPDKPNITREGDGYRYTYADCFWDAWQAAMAHKGAELKQAQEARRQAQTELAAMQDKRNRIGLDIDRALRGEVNEQSPIAGRLKLIADSAAQSVATLRQDAIALNLMRSVGLDKHVARECEQIVRQLLLPAAPKQEGST